MPNIVGKHLCAANMTRSCHGCKVPAGACEISDNALTVQVHADLQSIREQILAVCCQVAIVGVSLLAMTPGAEYTAIISSHS